MNKKEQRKANLERHYAALEKLGATNGKKTSLALLKLENKARNATTALCNGDAGEEMFEDTLEKVEAEVNMILPAVKGIFINRDARGYALKIGDKEMRADYSESGLHRDFGGYGILAPDFD